MNSKYAVHAGAGNEGAIRTVVQGSCQVDAAGTRVQRGVNLCGTGSPHVEPRCGLYRVIIFDWTADKIDILKKKHIII